VDVVNVVVPAVAGLTGVVVGGLLTVYVETRRGAAAAYDRALRALANQQASRRGVGLQIPTQYLGTVEAAEAQRIQVELSAKAVERFLSAAADTRAALASLHPRNPDLKAYWDRFEVPEEAFDALASLLAERRKKPLKRHTGS
jgi:hypothetical protein